MFLDILPIVAIIIRWLRSWIVIGKRNSYCLKHIYQTWVSKNMYYVSFLWKNKFLKILKCIFNLRNIKKSNVLYLSKQVFYLHCSYWWIAFNTDTLISTFHSHSFSSLFHGFGYFYTPYTQNNIFRLNILSFPLCDMMRYWCYLFYQSCKFMH